MQIPVEYLLKSQFGNGVTIIDVDAVDAVVAIVAVAVVVVVKDWPSLEVDHFIAKIFYLSTNPFYVSQAV